MEDDHRARTIGDSAPRASDGNDDVRGDVRDNVREGLAVDDSRLTEGKDQSQGQDGEEKEKEEGEEEEEGKEEEEEVAEEEEEASAAVSSEAAWGGKRGAALSSADEEVSLGSFVSYLSTFSCPRSYEYAACWSAG